MVEAPYNVVVIGGGIVGLAVALEITRRFPALRLLLVEKEDRVARHQSGPNSGVIHSGVYYRPGSLKARLCVQGASEMLRFCRDHGIAYEICGKAIVATQEPQRAALEELHRRAVANEVPNVRFLTAAELREFEPHAVGTAALLVPGTAITDYS